MPQTGMPFVRNCWLRLPDQPPIQIDSEAWFRWLAQATRFCYQPAQLTV